MNEEPKYCKRLIEVDLPIRKISEHARREKSIRHGHISTLHVWWARKPLAVCRATLCASLWPDPGDPLCPNEFISTAKEEMLKWTGMRYLNLLSENSVSRFIKIQKSPAMLEDNLELRKALLDFIVDFSNWDNSNVKEFLSTSHNLTKTAHICFNEIKDTKPLVLDPFAGGGSIPLESLRVCTDVFASDLNPVAVILNKVMIEYIPSYGPQLANMVNEWGKKMKAAAQAELGDFYPNDSDGSTPIAYLWARTIVCEGPQCGAEVPLINSLWLSKKKNNSFALKLIPDFSNKKIRVDIIKSPQNKDVGEGTIKRGAVTCPICGYTTPVSAIRNQLKKKNGGVDNARLVCIVTVHPNKRGRFYRLPVEKDIECVQAAKAKIEELQQKNDQQLSLIPNEILPLMSGVFNVPLYGHTTWGSLFSSRQALTLITYVKIINDYLNEIDINNDEVLKAVLTCLALVIDRQANTLTTLSRWHNTRENIEGAFARQALPMSWDFCEANPFSNASGSFDGALEWIVDICEREGFLKDLIEGQASAELMSATSHVLPNDSVQCFMTDPPYYNAVPYAELSDFFYVWLKRAIGRIYPDLFKGNLSPKDEELCEMAGWDKERYPHKDGRCSKIR